MQSTRSRGGKKLQAKTKTNNEDAERIREGNTEMREREKKSPLEDKSDSTGIDIYTAQARCFLLSFLRSFLPSVPKGLEILFHMMTHPSFSIFSLLNPISSNVAGPLGPGGFIGASYTPAEGEGPDGCRGGPPPIAAPDPLAVRGGCGRRPGPPGPGPGPGCACDMGRAACP